MLRAIQVSRFGGPEVLKVVSNVKLTKPKPFEVSVPT